MVIGLFLPVILFANSTVIDQFEIIGNTKTHPSTILQELTFSEGDEVTPEDIEASTQSIKDLGLFQAVEINTNTLDDGSVVAEITVKEKRYNFILPKLNRNGDGDITTGIVWRADNLFGRNQRSKFTVAYQKFDGADEEDETQVAWDYSYPRITNTPYSLAFRVSHEDTTLEETLNAKTGKYERTRDQFRLLVGRWIQRQGPSQGLVISAGPVYEKYDHTFLSGTSGLLPDLTVLAAQFEINGYYVHDHLLSRSGHHFGYELTYSDPEHTGSDIDFTKHFLFYRKYIPLPYDDHSNLNIQFRLGYISRSILGPPEFKIGGSSNLRGYDRDTVEGNSFFIFNAEWLHPVLNRETLRSAVIFDAGNAWENSSDAQLSDLKYGVGFGLRWKIKRFVRTDVRLDIARGLSDGGETKAYLSTRSTF